MICNNSGIGEMVLISCCKKPIHSNCAEDHCICPECKQFYVTVPINNYDYVSIYRQSPEQLKILDRELRSRITKSDYHKKYVGYFPYQWFTKKKCNFSQMWKIFTYELMTNYNWKHTVACGRAIWSMAKDQDYNHEHIYLAIYNTDYRIVREQLQHLFSVLPDHISVSLHEGIIIISIPGMVRNICVYIDYNKSPFWIIYNPKSYFNTYGTLYHPDTGVQMTVNALVNDRAPNFKELPMLDKVIGYNHKVDYYNKPAFLLDNIYPEYSFNIITPCKNRLVSEIEELVGKVVNVNIQYANNSKFSLVSKQGTLIIKPTVVTAKAVYRQVCKAVYIQPLELRAFNHTVQSSMADGTQIDDQES